MQLLSLFFRFIEFDQFGYLEFYLSNVKVKHSSERWLYISSSLADIQLGRLFPTFFKHSI